jgi:hypothetical protein
VAVEIGLIAVLGVFATAFVVASFLGRAHGGTIFFSLVTLAALIGAASLPHDRAGWLVTWKPVTAAAVQQSYQRNTGSATLDLTALTLDGRTVSTRLEVHVGEVVIKPPKDATVVLRYHVAVGDVRLPDDSHSGVNIKNDKEKPVILAPPSGTLSTGTVIVDVDLAVGNLWIDQGSRTPRTPGTAPAPKTVPAPRAAPAPRSAPGAAAERVSL